METDSTTTEGHAIPARAHRIAFVCNGQGPQWWGMGRQLLETEPVFAEAIAECEQAMRPHVSWRLIEELTRDEATSRMQETPILQPGMFAIQIALARLWETWGVAPDGVIGHSMGEVGAACIAGVLSLSDTAAITCRRSRIQHTARPDGGMMFVERGPEDFAQLAARYSDRIWLSAENSPRAITVSGERAALAALADDLERDGVFCRLLEVNCACHGPHMDELRPALEAALGQFEGRDGRIPIYSTLQGRAMPGSAFGASHWWENFRKPVLFAPAIRAMLEDGFDTFIELSPHPVLRASILEIAGAMNRDDVLVVASLRRTADDRRTMLQALGELRAGGRPGDFQRLGSGPAGTLELAGIRPGGSTTARTSYELRGDLTAGLDRLLTDVLGGAPLERSTPLVELGLDSLMAMQVLNVLRRELAVSLRMPDLLRDHMTAGALEAHVREQLARAPSPAPASAPARAATGRLPLSRAQQRLWFLHALAGEGPAYNVHYAYRLRGDLDTRALAAAVQAIVDRHDSLRTTYHAEGGVPYQIVHRSADAELPCSPASPDELDARLEAFRRRPFDLSAHLMLRTELLRLADDDHVLLVNLHHIAVDGWSLGCLFRELDALYAAHRRGAPPPLPPLAASYTELALDETGSPDDLRYWQDRLRGAPPSTTLPPHRPRALDPSHEAGVVHLELSEPLTAALRRLARTHRATLNTALMAMFTALIARRTGANDLVIGTPVANRTSAESEALIGVFINFVAIRTQLDPRMTFQAVLDHTRATVNEALAHQAAPFEQVVTHLERQGSAHAHPVFQILFQTLSATIADLALDGLRCERLPFRHTGAKFDLTVIMVEHATRVSGSIEYSHDRYVDEQIRTLAADLVACLEAAVADPAIALAGLPIAGGPAPIVPAPPAIDTGLYQLLEQQMGLTPAAPALNHAGRTLSYGRLAEASEALAARLRAHGLPPEFRAGVCLPRTPDLVVALLAILRAGGCYVPIDPQYPHERQAYMLEDSRAEVLVTDASGRDRFRGFTGLVLDASEASRAAPPPASAPAAAVHPDQLAYLIYTSGSTGRPKGAGITHRNAVSFLRWAARAFPTITGEAVLASTSICFDLSIFELFFPLAFGGRVVLVDNLLEAHETLAAEAVTLINTVPSVMDGFLQRGPVPPSVATVNLAGEPLSRRLADALYAHATVERVVNLYGPTEDTTYSTWKRVARDDGERPPIGAPIDGSFACIVDADLQLVPDGVAGELLLGGAGLCRGYERRPGLTAERFVPDPFSGTPGGRLYRTGDLCRRLPGGDLDYLQRNDHQVKLRGFRIELAEIDHCAATVAGVGECVTVVQAADSAAARLVSFVVPEATRDPGLAGRILARLRQVLPAHSVPSHVVLLDRLPVTPNGKVDRKALAALTVEIVAGGPEARRPEKPDELALAEIWASVLRIGAEHVTLDADFFSLGGNSLLIIQLIARLRDRWGIDTTIRTMFERRTFASQVDLVGELQRASAPTKPAGVPAGRKVIRL